MKENVIMRLMGANLGVLFFFGFDSWLLSVYALYILGAFIHPFGFLYICLSIKKKN